MGSSARTPRRPNHASSETHRASTAGSSRRAVVGEGVATRCLGDADERVREHPTVLGGALDLDEQRDRIGGLVEDPLDDLRELGVVAGRGPEQHAERRLVPRHEAEVRGEPGLHALAPRGRRLRRLGQQAEQLVTDVLEELDEQRPLRREVLVQHGLRDAGGASATSSIDVAWKPFVANTLHATSRS